VGNIQVTIARKEIRISGIHTHVFARFLTTELLEIVMSKSRRVNVFFEGEPGPGGGGMDIKIVFDGELSDLEMNTVARFFKLKGANIKVVR